MKKSSDILLTSLGAVLGLGTACAVRAAAIKKNLSGAPPAIRWTPADEAACAERLSKMVQIPTVSRKQEEDYPEFRRFQALLKELFPKTFAAAEDHEVDGNILLRIPGTDPERGALLLMGHQDVVPADQEGWTDDPFSGIIRDGKVWGRGAMDCKSTLCCVFSAVEALLEEGFTFKEDLWIFSARNEENSGGGSDAAADWLKEQGVRLNVVIDEGGAVIGGVIPGLQAPCAAVGLVEKGFVNLKFTAKGSGGHASTPPKNSPIARLSKFVTEVEKRKLFSKELAAPLPQMFAAVAPYLSYPLRFVLGNLWLFGGLTKNALGLFSDMATAFVSTTAAFTMASGSSAPNVLPDSAEMICNIRPAVHQTAAECIAILEKTAKKYDIETEVLFSRDPSKTTPTDTDEFRYLTQCISACLPDTVPTPYLMTGGTDSRRFEVVCDNIFRFTPTRLTPEQLAAMHAANENIDIAAVAEGVEFFKYYLKGYNGSKK
ncbi:MAG: M20/M25/M40 family metallo-hydrolase [Clostridia bacterium]|nr:M20/M25/M40 family metallo-hydrolase [Clostridia bacterium]